jgi:hypothetical protein
MSCHSFSFLPGRETFESSLTACFSHLAEGRFLLIDGCLFNIYLLIREEQGRHRAGASKKRTPKKTGQAVELAFVDQSYFRFKS